ncbi:unnamed protein product [Ilex paraguariensis]|uniref:MATH domain-containing protein n=1 Tax=Ilex paraguariensis TaxID=185542 RepID=A0ABC8TZ03_9AQUA
MEIESISEWIRKGKWERAYLSLLGNIRGRYITSWLGDADGRLRHFHRFKTEFGFAKLLSIDTFKDASNGYLIDDSCVFGAEVYVIKSTGRGECLSLKEETYDNSYSWQIKKFSEIKEERLFSEPFTIGEHKWFETLEFLT